MKKIVLFTLTSLLFAVPSFCGTTTAVNDKLDLRAGMNFGGNMHYSTTVSQYSYSSSGDSDVKDTGFFIGADYSINKQANTDFGIGAQYLFERDSFSVLPIDVYGKLKIGHDFTAVGRLGYNFLSIKDKSSDTKINNGVCYSLGLEGNISPEMKLFADYSVYNGGVTSTYSDSNIGSYDVKTDISYSTFGFGLSFNIQ